MSNPVDVQSIIEVVNNSKEILVAIAKEPDFDQVAAALGIFNALKRYQKTVTITCPTPMVVEYSHLVGLDKIKQSVGNKNLVVSFDYIQDSIEKVSYNVEGNKFNLVIQPRKGGKPLDPQNVSFAYVGLEAQLIIIVGASRFEDLGEVFEKNQTVFSQAVTVSLNKSLDLHFAHSSVINPNASSICEIASEFLEQIGMPATNDSATNLLSGIDYMTNRFASPNTPASAFVAAGKLMQNGGVRKEQVVRPKVPNIPLPLQKSANQPLVRPMTINQSQEIAPTPSQLKVSQMENPEPPPKEWLEPKIFQGSTKL